MTSPGPHPSPDTTGRQIRIFLSGDVMTGRGIDQILATPGDPTLYESWAKSAMRYVELAEQSHGAIPRPVTPEYVWGEALGELDKADVDVRIINLETAVTDHGQPWPGKGIHYRMHPANVDLLSAAGVDCCVLANNHVLDWSYEGLNQTLGSLHDAGISTVGAGADSDEARRPAVIEIGGGSRVMVLAVGVTTSGIPRSWSASAARPGVWTVTSLNGEVIKAIRDQLSKEVRPGDATVVSIHWGPNWGYELPEEHRRFARALVDEGVDIVHGHSSHHPLAIEVYRDRLILYGCGDLINDYEGIGGHDELRPGLGLLYLVTLDPDRLHRLDMVPMRLRRFRLERAHPSEVAWLAETLTRESRRFGTRVEPSASGHLWAIW